MNPVEYLLSLGYAPRVDFIAQDDSDGRGPYIVEWLREDAPCPVAIGKPEDDAE